MRAAVRETLAPHPELLSAGWRDRLIERGVSALYREYTGVSQPKRQWDPHLGFDWRRLRPGLSPAVRNLVEGFFAVEHFAPDYTVRITELVRRSWGRASFQLAWGAEEAKHADLWGNVLVFSGAMTRDRLEEYAAALRSAAWAPPWDSPLHMTVYTVFQERATQLIYQRTRQLVEADRPADPTLVAALRAITVDEAAHFRFYADVVRLYLYYKPDAALRAIDDVLRHFVMPATEMYPGYRAFVDELTRHDVFSPRVFLREVVPPALAKLGVSGLAALRAGVLRSKQAPGPDGDNRGGDLLGEELPVIEDGVRAMFARLGRYEERVGFAPADRVAFSPARGPAGGRGEDGNDA